MLNYEICNNNKEEWVVFVHGIGGSSRTWNRQARVFGKYYNILMLDLPGHGESQQNVKIQINAINDDIKEVLDFLKIEKAHFVGMSLGTLVIANFAVQYPDYVKAIVFGGATIQIDGIYKLVLNIVAKIKRWFPHQFLYNTFAKLMLSKKNHRLSRRFFIKEMLKMKRESFMKWIDYISAMTHPQKLINNLKNTNIKMLFISGEEDFCFLKSVKKIQKKIKSSKLEIIEKCGHICTLEKSKEFNERALNFLQSMHKPILV